MDYSDPDKMCAVLEAVGIDTEKNLTDHGTQHADDINLGERLSGNRSGTSLREEALSVVQDILEERIDVALAVSAISDEKTGIVEIAGQTGGDAKSG